MSGSCIWFSVDVHKKRLHILILKKKEVVITSLVWKIMFLTKSGLCQIDQQSYGCCLVRQEEEKLWRGKQFCSLKYKNYVIRCSDLHQGSFQQQEKDITNLALFLFGGRRERGGGRTVTG